MRLDAAELLSAIKKGDFKKAKKELQTYGLPESKSKITDYLLLQTAVSKNYKCIVNLLIEARCRANKSANKVSEKKSIVKLCLAVKKDNVQVLETLLNKDANISAKDKYKALLVVTTAKNLKVQDILLEYVQDTINEVDAEGDTVLLAACKKLLLLEDNTSKKIEATVAIIKLLLSYGASVDLQDQSGQSAFHYAVRFKQKELIPLFLSACFDKNVCDNKDNNVLHVYLKHLKSTGNLSQVDIDMILDMLSSKISVQTKNAEGITPIFLAFSFNNKILLRKSLARLLRNTNIRDNRGNTLLMHLIKGQDLTSNEKDFIPIVKELTRKKIDLNAQNLLGRTALHYAALKRRPWVLNWLIKYGANVNAKSNLGHTALHYLGQELSYRNTDKNLIEKLVKSGADVNAKNNDGMTPLMVAAQLGHDEVAQELVKHQGADLHCASHKYLHTALHFAVINSNSYVVKVLLEHGASINARSIDGRTALHYACFNEQRHFNKKTAIEFLLEHGADINIRDDFGKTPLDYTLRCEKDVEAIQTLNTHAILLKQANLPTQYVDLNSNKDVYMEVVARCRNEMANMKSCKIKEDVSLADMLHMNDSQLAVLSNNIKVKHIFNPDKNFAAIKKKYKTYGYLLVNRYRIGEVRHSLLKSAKASFQKIANNTDWPEEISEKILDYISIEDLQNINISAKPKVACKRKFVPNASGEKIGQPAKRNRLQEKDEEPLLIIPNVGFFTRKNMFA